MLLWRRRWRRAVRGGSAIFEGAQCEKTAKAVLFAILALLTASMALGGLGRWRSGETLSSVFRHLAYAYEDYGFPYCFLPNLLNRASAPVDTIPDGGPGPETLAGTRHPPAAPPRRM